MCYQMNWLLAFGYTVLLLVGGAMQESDDFSLASTDFNNPEVHLRLSQVLVRNGYPAETHTALTEDGYLLAVHHIPQKIPDASKVVVIFRCLYCTSYVYFMLGPHKALGYLLADAGYDVWLAELRGNSYSNSHVKFHQDQSKFWDFSWHEMGIYDVPAVLDYVISKTSADKVYCIGYSMGTTAMFVTGAMRPEYMSRIHLFIALAPVSYCSHATGLPALLGKILTPEVMNLIPNKPVFPKEAVELLRLMGRTLCSTRLTTTLICKTMYSLLGGYDFNKLNTTAMPVIAAHVPDQESIKTVFHYMQGIPSAKFRQYDYGTFRNLRVYGTKSPTEYNISRITAPVALIWSEGDSLANSQDVRQLADRLPNVVFQKEVKDINFSHVDFVFGNDAPRLVNTEVMKLLDDWSAPVRL